MFFNRLRGDFRILKISGNFSIKLIEHLIGIDFIFTTIRTNKLWFHLSIFYPYQMPFSFVYLLRFNAFNISLLSWMTSLTRFSKSWSLLVDLRLSFSIAILCTCFLVHLSILLSILFISSHLLCSNIYHKFEEKKKVNKAIK